MTDPDFEHVVVFDHAVLVNRVQFDWCRRSIPQHRFVEYEPADLDWLVPLGMAPLIADLEERHVAAVQALAERITRCLEEEWIDAIHRNGERFRDRDGVLPFYMQSGDRRRDPVRAVDHARTPNRPAGR